MPQGNGATEFTVGIPDGITIAIDSCDATGNDCTTPVSPTAGTNIFTATGAALYQITATNSSSTQQVCQFAIPPSSCITRAGSSSQPPCNLWVVDTTGAWAGRSIAIPSF